MFANFRVKQVICSGVLQVFAQAVGQRVWFKTNVKKRKPQQLQILQVMAAMCWGIACSFGSLDQWFLQQVVKSAPSALEDNFDFEIFSTFFPGHRAPRRFRTKTADDEIRWSKKKWRSGLRRLSVFSFKQNIPTLLFREEQHLHWQLGITNHVETFGMFDTWLRWTKVNLGFEVVPICDALDWTVKLLAYQMGQNFGGLPEIWREITPKQLGKLLWHFALLAPRKVRKLESISQVTRHAGWPTGGKMTTSAQGSEECPWMEIGI